MNSTTSKQTSPAVPGVVPGAEPYRATGEEVDAAPSRPARRRQPPGVPAAAAYEPRLDGPSPQIGDDDRGRRGGRREVEQLRRAAAGAPQRVREHEEDDEGGHREGHEGTTRTAGRVDTALNHTSNTAQAAATANGSNARRVMPSSYLVTS